jgi:phage terminase large subunit GpA-like protein
LKDIDRLLSEVATRYAGGFEPPPLMTVSEWADMYRVLPPECCATPGQWHTDRVPYLKEIMDAFTNPLIHTIVIMAGSQVAKTEAIINMLCYIIDCDPGSILLAQPTDKLAYTFVTKRFNPTIRDTPRLHGKIKDSRSKDSDNTMFEKSFPGGYIVFMGAGSPANLAGRPIRYLFCDDLDRFPPSAGKEGDPVELMMVRTTTYGNSKVVLVSTPTVKGASRIETLYNESDQRKLYVPCPHCGHFQIMYFDQVNWDKVGEGKHRHKFNTAQYACVECGALSGEGQKQNMVAKGEWRPHAPLDGVAGFWLNAVYSPFFSMAKLAKDYVTSKRSGFNSIKRFVNTRKGESFEISSEVIDHSSLKGRRELYEAEVPYGVGLLTGAVDVQDNRLEAQIVGWGIEREAYAIDHIVFDGNPRDAQVWKELDSYLKQTWTNKHGHKFKLSNTCIDIGGHNTQNVYKYVRENNCAELPLRAIMGKGGWRAIKGDGDWKEDLVKKNPTWENARGCYLHTLYVDEIKRELFNRLKITRPGPEYMHFPLKKRGERYIYDEEYFEQLTGEKLTVDDSGGIKVYQWKKQRPRNEALDLWVYSIAAYVILNPLHMERWVEATMPPKEPTEEEKAKDTPMPKKEYNRHTGGKKWKINGW